MVGAYYGKLIARAEAEQRIARVPHDPAAPVWTAWDLGIRDATAIWFAQAIGREVRLIDYYEASGVDLGHYVREIVARPYAYAGHVVPQARISHKRGRAEARSGDIRAHLAAVDPQQRSLAAAKMPATQRADFSLRELAGEAEPDEIMPAGCASFCRDAGLFIRPGLRLRVSRKQRVARPQEAMRGDLAVPGLGQAHAFAAQRFRLDVAFAID